MEEKVEKLLIHAGGAGLYQIIILIVGFFIWSSLTIHGTSIPMLEAMPKVKIDNNTEEKLTYDICKKNYEIIETYDFSWIIEQGIECNQAKVSLIGFSIYGGLTCGSLVFSLMTKYLTYKTLIIIFTFIYVFILFLITIINNYVFTLFCLFFLGICNGFSTMSTLTLVSESVSSAKRSLFAGIINIGYSFGAIMYTILYVILGKWRYVFWIENIIGISCGVLYFLLAENSPRNFFSNNKIEEAIEILRRIAIFNGKFEEFEEKVNDKEFDPLLRNDQEGVDKDLTVELKPKYSYSSLFKYKSVLYKFLIFTFMIMSTSFLTNAVVINTKTMAGNTYIIIVSLYCIEVVAGISCSFIINIPALGRKKSLIGFFLCITFGFILTLIFGKNAIGGWLSMVIIRFCITGAYTTFFIYFLESYPTPIRSLGFGLNLACGNFAGMISPIIIEYINKYLLYAIFAILSGINIFLTFFLKETVGKPMLETIEELEVPDIEKDKLIPGRESDINILDINKPKDEKKEPLLNENEEKKENEEKRDLDSNENEEKEKKKCAENSNEKDKKEENIGKKDSNLNEKNEEEDNEKKKESKDSNEKDEKEENIKKKKPNSDEKEEKVEKEEKKELDLKEKDEKKEKKEKDIRLKEEK